MRVSFLIEIDNRMWRCFYISTYEGVVTAELVSEEKSAIKPCPFCKSQKVKLDGKSVLTGFNGLDRRVERETYSMRCNVCHARGPTVSGKVIQGNLPCGAEIPSWATDRKTIMRKAIEAWNQC